MTKDYSKAEEVILPEGYDNPVWVVDLMRTIGAVYTSSQARRLIASESVWVDKDLVTDFKRAISWQKGTTIKVGKDRIYRLG